MPQTEYFIPGNNSSDPIHVQKASIPMEKGGYLIYGTAHMHTGAINATLYGQVNFYLKSNTFFFKLVYVFLIRFFSNN